MYSLVEEWKGSDLSKSEFLESKSLSYHQFNYWLKKYNKEYSNEEIKPEVSFFSVEENLGKSTKTSSVKSVELKKMRIDLPGGISITIY